MNERIYHGLTMSPLSAAEKCSESLDIWLTSDAVSAPFNLRQLSGQEQARYEQIRSDRRRKEFELSRGLLQALPPASRPQSLSHSGSFAAIARCPDGFSVGIDLEVHRARDVISLSRFAFHETEAAAVKTANDSLALFYALWVLKEAAAKALNLELVQALKQCVFLPKPGQWSGMLPTDQPWRARAWMPRLDLSLAAVVVGNGAALGCNAIEWPANASGAWAEIVNLAGGDASAL
jgi:4'-phosphopantetheinyl transferase